MTTLGWRPIGDPVTKLLDAIDECKATWGDDSAYKDVRANLDDAVQELDILKASPGKRAAMRASLPNMAGQERSQPAEKMEAQSAGH